MCSHSYRCFYSSQSPVLSKNDTDTPFSITLPICTRKLSEVYMNTKHRINKKKEINNLLKHLPDKQSFIELSRIIRFGRRLGEGSYGNVYECTINEHLFAVKQARISDKSMTEPFNKHDDKWNEVNMLLGKIQDIIKHNICPNLPLIYNVFYSDNAQFTYRSQVQHHPAVYIVMELGTCGILKNYFESIHPDKEMYAALFQIMAGLHALQKHAGIYTNDIKRDNILVYNVKPGGYWIYIIDNRKYYIPNFGKLFVISDFGTSTYNSSKFWIDTTDVIHMFIGSKPKVLHNGFHGMSSTPVHIKNILEPYVKNLKVREPNNNPLFFDFTALKFINTFFNKDYLGFNNYYGNMGQHLATYVI